VSAAAGRALCLLGVYLVSGLLFSLLWWPILLDPLRSVLRVGILGGIAGLFPLLFARPRITGPPGGERGVRLEIGPGEAQLIGLAVWVVHVLLQIVLIRFKPYLMLSQYLREELWVLWLVMLPLALAYGLLFRAWGRLAR